MSVSSVKNLNGETFSAVQDTFLTDIVSSNSANWNEISAYQANSGNYQLTADMTAYANSADVTGTAQYGLTTAGWTEITAGGSDVPEGVMVESGLEYDTSGNISAYSGSAFAAQLPEEEEVEFEEIDLTDYQPVSGMTAYQSAGDYYSASNPSGFITAVPVGTMNESAFSYDASDNITGYNGSAFAQGGGGEFPQSATEAVEYVTATSANIDSTIDNVSANSGVWGGSALPISAGKGVKISLQNDTLVFENDEAVLFETNSISGVSAVTCSESVKNFERIAVLPSRFASNLGGGTGPYQYYETKWLTTGADTVNTIQPMVFEYLFWKIAKYSANNDFTQFVWNSGFEVQQDTQTYRNLTTCNVGIKKIVGINRIAGGV